jgi:uncharacterized small protein (DUF1192 family)
LDHHTHEETTDVLLKNIKHRSDDLQRHTIAATDAYVHSFEIPALQERQEYLKAEIAKKKAKRGA